MPYDAKQVRLFQMIAHGKIAHKGLSKGKASSLLTEAGQKHDSGQPRRRKLSDK